VVAPAGQPLALDLVAKDRAGIGCEGGVLVELVGRQRSIQLAGSPGRHRSGRHHPLADGGRCFTRFGAE